MAFPFTPDTSFTDNSVPNVTAGFLNRAQAGINAAAIPAYSRIDVTAYSEDQTNLQLVCIAPYMALDAGTSQYVGVPAVSSIQLNTGFTTATWQFLYARSLNGVVSYSISTTAPEATLRYKAGDETYRFLISFYCDVSGYIRRFTARNGVYTFQEKIYLNGSDTTAVSLATGSWNTINYAANSFPSSATTCRVFFQCWLGTGQTLYLRDFSTIHNQTTGARGISSGGLTSASSLAIFTHEFWGTTGFGYFVGSSSGTIVAKTLFDGYTE